MSSSVLSVIITTLLGLIQTGFVLTMTAIIRVIRNQQEIHDDTKVHLQGFSYRIKEVHDILTDVSMVSTDDLMKVM